MDVQRKESKGVAVECRTLDTLLLSVLRDRRFIVHDDEGFAQARVMFGAEHKSGLLLAALRSVKPSQPIHCTLRRPRKRLDIIGR